MKRHLLFFLPGLFLLSCLLVACGDVYNPTLDAGGPIDTSVAQNQRSTQAQLATGKFQEFALPQNDSGLMRPAIDAQGRLWFGEMSRNYLASFDPRSGKFWQETPPRGKSGIMGVVAAPDNTIWFAEQYANYIGQYFPQSGKYKVYPLPMVNAPGPSTPGKTQSLPSAPNDLALDAHGTLWFTELNANAIASLNTASGSIRQYPLTSAPNAKALNPYGITADSRGNIWFSEASSSRLGKLNPVSGQISYYTPPGVTSPLMEVASAANGQIWATTFASGQVIQFDPASSHFTLYSAPNPSSSAGGVYGIIVASTGDVWIAVTAESMLARLDVKQQRFFYYPIPTRNSLPIGLVEGKNHEIWFTESGSNKIGMLQP